jgi:hypothetical protein
MREYHLYCIDGNERIVGSYKFSDTGDSHAVKKARRLCGDYGVEVWERERLVARLQGGGS